MFVTLLCEYWGVAARVLRGWSIGSVGGFLQGLRRSLGSLELCVVGLGTLCVDRTVHLWCEICL